MNGSSRVTLGWPALIVGALVLLGAGAGLGYFTIRPWSDNAGVQQPSASARPAAPGGSPPAAPVPPGGSAPDIVVTLTLEAAPVAPAPVTIFTAPSGRSASAKISASRIAVSEVVSAGLRTQVFPAASAGAATTAAEPARNERRFTAREIIDYRVVRSSACDTAR